MRQQLHPPAPMDGPLQAGSPATVTQVSHFYYCDRHKSPTTLTITTGTYLPLLVPHYCDKHTAHLSPKGMHAHILPKEQTCNIYIGICVKIKTKTRAGFHHLNILAYNQCGWALKYKPYFVRQHYTYTDNLTCTVL